MPRVRLYVLWMMSRSGLIGEKEIDERNNECRVGVLCFEFCPFQSSCSVKTLSWAVWNAERRARAEMQVIEATAK